MRKFIVGSGLAGICALAVLLAVVMVSGKGPFAQAMGGTGNTPNVVAIDMQTAGNSQSTVGTIDRCVQVAVGTPFDFDAVLDDIPNGKDFSSQDYYLNFNSVKLGAPAMDHGPGTILLALVVGSSLFDGSTIGASSFHSVVMDLGVPAAAVAEQPGQRGILGRYTLTPLAPGAGTLTFLTMTDPDVIMGDSNGVDWFDPAGDVGDQLWDAANTPVYGIVAIGTACPPDTDIKIVSFGPVIGPPYEVPVSVQEYEEFIKVIHNNGPGPADVLLAKTVDIPDNADPAIEPCEVSYVCEDAEEIDVAAGVEFGEKIMGVCTPIGVGPDIFPCTPGAHFCAKAVQGLVDEVTVNHLLVAVPETTDIPILETFDVHCYEASFHDYTFENVVAPVYIYDGTEDPPGNGTNLAGDPNDSNNGPVEFVKHIGFTAVADLKIVSQVLDPSGISFLDMDKDGTPDPPFFEDGVTANVPVIKTLHNNGPYAPADADLTKSALAVRPPYPDALGGENAAIGECGPYGVGDRVDNDMDGVVDDGCPLPFCTASITPPTDQELDLPAGADVMHVGEVASVTCAKNGILPAVGGAESPPGDGIDNDGDTWIDDGLPIGIEKDDDGDGLIDEDRIGGGGVDSDNDGAIDEDACDTVDNDGDTLVDEDDPLGNDDCDWSILGVLPRVDEDSAIVPVVLVVQNAIQPKDPHVVDDDPSNNTAVSSLLFDTDGDTVPDMPLLLARDLNPVWGVTIDEANADQLTSPVDNDCIQYQPCKKEFAMAIGGNEPFVGQVTITPIDFAEAHGVLGMDMTPFTADDPVNGQTAGQISFTATMAMMPGDCSSPVGGAATLYEGALSVAGGEGPDTWGALTATASYPPEVDRDPVIRGVRAGGAVEWLRKTGTLSGIGMEVNNIIFNAGTMWLAVTVLGDPVNPSAIDSCPPMTANTIMLGAAPEDANVVYEACMVQSGAPLDKMFINQMTREDMPTFTLVNVDFATCTAPESDMNVGLCKDEDIGDTHDAQCDALLVDELIPASLPVDFDVEITVDPGTASQPVDVSLGIVSHDPCTAEWIAEAGDTEYDLTQVGATNLDRLDFTTPNIAAPTIYTRSYEIHCTDPGYYPQNIQITASVTTANVPPIGDPDESNNTAENRVDVTSVDIPDVDGDTVLNDDDNCPWVYNPDQIDTDGDGMGDACDPDDDDDGILDGDDDCPTAPEGGDGDPTDGCPGSDVTGLDVTYTEPVLVDVSEDVVESVSATALNGGHVADIDFILLLKSDVSDPADKCEARWNDEPGDGYVEDVIADELISQLEVTVDDVASGLLASVDRTYTVHCNAPSYHDVILEVSAVPAPPVIDPDVQNGNVFKDLTLEIEATALADLKKVGIALLNDNCDGPPPAQIDAGVDVDLCIVEVFHNNGPYGPATLTDVRTIDGPADCTVNGNALPWEVTYDDDLLEVSVDETNTFVATLNCALPSDHTIELDDVISISQQEIHLRDPDLSNNSASSTYDFEVVTNANVVVDVVVDAPQSMWVSEDEMFTVTKTFSYTDPTGAPAIPETMVEPEVDQTLQPTGQLADDCQVSFHVTNELLAKVVDLVIKSDGVVVDPPTPYGWEASDVVWSEYGGSITVEYQIPLEPGDTVVVEEWDKHCDAPSTHEFTLDTHLERNADKDPHIIFQPDGEQDVWTEDVLAEADLGIVDWFFLDIPLVDTDGDTSPDTPLVKVAPSSYVYGHEKEVIHNNGPYGPVDFSEVVLAQAADPCAVSYNVTGDETLILVDGNPVSMPPGTDLVSATGGSIQITLDSEDLEVSVDLWSAFLWNFHIDDQTECEVDITKTITSEVHVLEPEQDDKPNEAAKTVIVCADTDGDTVADDCPTLDEADNCKHDPNPGQEDSDGDGIGDACDDQPYHDVGTKSCLVFGPAPVNLSDSSGRYMWVICEIGNFSDHAEQVSITLDVEDPPAGCTEDQALILPGFSEFWMTSGEQKWVLWRVRYECHEAIPGVYPLDIEACIAHDTVHGDGGDEIGPFLDNNCWNGVRNLIVHNPGP